MQWFSTCARALSCESNNLGDAVIFSPRESFGYKFCKAVASMKGQLSADGLLWAQEAVGCMKKQIARDVFFGDPHNCNRFSEAGEACVVSKGGAHEGLTVSSLTEIQPREAYYEYRHKDMTPFQRLDVISAMSKCFADWIPTKSPTSSPTNFPTCTY